MSTLTRAQIHPDDLSRYAPKRMRDARLHLASVGGRLSGVAQCGAADMSMEEPEPDAPVPRDLDELAGPALPPWRRDSEFEGDVAIRRMRDARAFAPQEPAEPRWQDTASMSGASIPVATLVRATAAIVVATFGALIFVGALPLTVPPALRDVIASIGQTTSFVPPRQESSAAPARMTGRLDAAASVDHGVDAVPTARGPVDPVAGARLPAGEMLAIAPWPETVALANTAAPAVASSPAAPALRGLDAAEIDALIRRGEAFILQGDFAAARLVLRRAAEAGNGRAAVMVGATYDPVMLRRVGAIGVKPEPEQAREWYERAVALGSPDASERMAELGRD
jgi:hypothetical protein